MATITWTGTAGDRDWNNPLNWDQGHVPLVNDTVEISASVVGPASILVANGTVVSVPTSTINNHGTIALNATSFADLRIDGAVSLQGGGHVALSDNAGNRIYSIAGGSVLTNVDNVIEGAGEILSANGLSIVNSVGGRIDANAANNALYIHNINVTNAGVMQASGAGGLLLGSGAKIDGSGLIKALAGSHVDLAGTTISGQHLVSVGSGRRFTSTLSARCTSTTEPS
jgi:hypothetical protein